MRTFSITTLGCRVNHYESEQLATLLRARGMEQTDAAGADLRIINTCSVTVQAASKSRQTTRRMTRLPVLSAVGSATSTDDQPGIPDLFSAGVIGSGHRGRVIVTGCWATSDKSAAAAIPGVDAVLGHHDPIADELDRLLNLWQTDAPAAGDLPSIHSQRRAFTKALTDAGEDTKYTSFGVEKQASPDGSGHLKFTAGSTSHDSHPVNNNPCGLAGELDRQSAMKVGTISLPQLVDRQSSHQRAFLKIQDGCDAHCTYCIIPRLRPNLWSKPVAETVAEARRLVEAGHKELVLTGIFLGAYGQPTALRRRQTAAGSLVRLIDALCTQVPGLGRLRFSSLEPGDVTHELLSVMAGHPQVVPHFHLPLQSGSDHILHRMNRQYTRDDFLRLADSLRAAFDRPALTTDIIVGFPGESDEEFKRTLEVVDRVGFLHIHAFPFSPRPGTAAARWKDDFVHGPVVNERIAMLQQSALEFSHTYRESFIGKFAEVMVERQSAHERELDSLPGHQHGRCERYFPIHFPSATRFAPGTNVRVRIKKVTPDHTIGATLVEANHLLVPSPCTQGEG